MRDCAAENRNRTVHRSYRFHTIWHWQVGDRAAASCSLRGEGTKSNDACASMLFDLSTLKSFGKKCVLKLHQTHRDESSTERILWCHQLGYSADVSISRALARLFEKKGAVADAKDVVSSEKEEMRIGEDIIGSEGWLRVRAEGEGPTTPQSHWVTGSSFACRAQSSMHWPVQAEASCIA